MEEVIKIEGGHRLSGTVHISGSKNATVALIPAAVLAHGPVTICGVPNISDVRSLSVLLKELGVEVTKKQDDIIIIDPTKMENRPLVGESVSKLRASYYFMGALLGKYGRVEMKMPGGCYLGPRPIDLHLKGFEALGATVKYERGSYIIEAKELVGNKIFLDISSVGATINIMMAAVYAKGRTTIENAAKEPEIIDIATMLNKMGAHIRGVGTSVITIDGVDTNDMKRETVHDQFSMVLQDTWLFEGTIRDNLIYNQENISDEQVIATAKAVGVHHFITTLPKGYDTYLDDSVTLSVGQKQLLTIARALLKDAPLLILDEATSSVDTRTEELIQKAMDKLMEGRTSFVIAHRLSTIRNADLILVMKDGNIIEQGNHDELMAANGFYADLYNSQFTEEVA